MEVDSKNKFSVDLHQKQIGRLGNLTYYLSFIQWF